MDFAFTTEQDRFRQEVRDFLNSELPPDYIDYVGPTIDDCVVHTENGFQIFKDMARKFGQKVWLSLNWTKETISFSSFVIKGRKLSFFSLLPLTHEVGCSNTIS